MSLNLSVKNSVSIRKWKYSDVLRNFKLYHHPLLVQTQQSLIQTSKFPDLYFPESTHPEPSPDQSHVCKYKKKTQMENTTSLLLLNSEAEMEDEQPSLSPAARLFHSPKFSCYIVIRIGCNTTIDPQVISAGLKETLLKHPRFSSKMVKDRKLCGQKRWIQVPVNMEDHVMVPTMDSDMEDADQFVRDYISHLTTRPLDLSKPLWELHILNVKTSDADALAVIRIHHSMGDGASLMSLLLACTRKTSDVDALPTVPTKRKHEGSSSNDLSVFWWLLLAIWSAVTLIANTLVDLVLFIATILVLKDTKSPIKGPPGVELTAKHFLHRTVSLDHIKQVKNAMNMTINDVVLGVTQAGLSRYLKCRYADENEKDEGAKKNGHNLPKSIRLRANILVNLRPADGIQELANMMAKKSKTKWGNRIGYVLVPFTIALQDDPLNYVHGAKSLMDRKKHSLEAYCTYLCAKLLTKLIGAKGAGAVAHRVLCNSTLAFSNLIGPLEEISYYGHPVTYIAPNVYGHPHALHMHFQSYVDKMTISIAVDPDVISDPEKLLDDLEESLKVIRDAVVEKGLNIAKEGRSSRV